MLAACGSGDAASSAEVDSAGSGADGDAACSCAGVACGENTCGDVCGQCSEAAPYCVDGQCAASCPSRRCDSRECGDDGCGGSCGSCESDEGCIEGACVRCGCDGLECGAGPCGESCGTCLDPRRVCVAHRCEAAPCPEAVIIVQEGDEVSPGTKLHLLGSQSWAQHGVVDAYAWEVVQPEGSQSTFQPSAHAPDPTFMANVVGTYVFRLTVTDSLGVGSCVPAESTVSVGSDRGVHVELTWTTPGDPDETDVGPGAGADLDLHLVHPGAAGGYDGDGDGVEDGYYDAVFDCYWFNHHPDWGAAGLDGDPALDRDDSDGGGPESVGLRAPEAGLTYEIGVHYGSDHGFGPSFATVRVYILGELAFESPAVELVSRDLWTFGTFTWPATAVAPARVCAGTTTPCESDGDCGAVSCTDRITPSYEHPAHPEQ